MPRSPPRSTGRARSGAHDGVARAGRAGAAPRMNPERRRALDIARRIADGEASTSTPGGNRARTLARGLRRLARWRRRWQARCTWRAQTWGHLQQLQRRRRWIRRGLSRLRSDARPHGRAQAASTTPAAPMLSGRDFVAEARRLARVRHPHVLAVHGASYHDGRAGHVDRLDRRRDAERAAGARRPLHGDELLRVLRASSPTRCERCTAPAWCTATSRPAT